MKIENICVGDVVSYYGSPVRVMYMMSTDMVLIRTKSETHETVPCEKLELLPVNPELLIRIGFRLDSIGRLSCSFGDNIELTVSDPDCCKVICQKHDSLSLLQMSFGAAVTFSELQGILRLFMSRDMDIYKDIVIEWFYNV